MKTAALVFSGGALRGFAQIGALKAIEEFTINKDIQIKTIIGTSFGAIMAAFVAVGLNADKMTKISRQNGFRILDFRDIQLLGPALIKGRKIHEYLKSNLYNKSFRDVEHTLIINTVDLLTGDEYIFTKKGLEKLYCKKIYHANIKLIDAVEASIAIPVLLSSKNLFGLMLADGGLTNPLALDLVNPSKYDYVFAIDVSMANYNFITQKSHNKINLLQQAVSIMQRQFCFQKNEKYKKNKKIIYIKPAVGNVNPLKRGEIDRIIKSGYAEAKKVLKSI
jgi:NTE family protein